MSQHAQRIQSILESFETSNEDLIRRLHGLDHNTAHTSPAAGGWNPAQISWHVGQTNSMLAAMLSRAAPGPEPAADGFQEQPWGAMALPAKVQTFAPLEPPADVTQREAIEKLRSGAAEFVAAVRALQEDFARSHVVNLPFGRLSIYQLGEFGGLHNQRHTAQLERALAPSAV